MENKILIGDRNTGKTTWLLNHVKKLTKSNEKIIILDSATEHADKSLLYKVETNFPDVDIVSFNNPVLVIDTGIEFDKYCQMCKNSLIFQTIKNSQSHILCIDLSFFLEKGHEFADIGEFSLARKYRQLYNNLAQQVALSCMMLTSEKFIKEVTVITDEIEFPKNGFDIGKYQNQDVTFISAVHPENAFGNFYKTFMHIDKTIGERGDKGL